MNQPAGISSSSAYSHSGRWKAMWVSEMFWTISSATPIDRNNDSSILGLRPPPWSAQRAELEVISSAP